MGRKILKFENEIHITAGAGVVGKLESEGPLGKYFDLTSPDSKFGMDTWEKAEAEMVRECSEIALKKSGKRQEDIDLAFAGDLTNQCVSTTIGLKDKAIPYIGLYGACSTFALGLGVAASYLDQGFCSTTLCAASSHFCSAERQYRFPLEYGCQRTPTSQTTVTGAGCVVLENGKGKGPYISEFLPGIVRDFGIKDAGNMGAAMAPACADTLKRYFTASQTTPETFDLILTGDLGWEGHAILLELLMDDGFDLSRNSDDCGKIIFDNEKQDVNCGGSGCGCSASVFSSYILERMKKKELFDVLLIGTGALLSANTVLQGETIPGVAHLVRIQTEE